MLYFHTFLHAFNENSLFVCIKKEICVADEQLCAELVGEFAGFGVLKQLRCGAGGKQRTCFSPDE